MAAQPLIYMDHLISTSVQLKSTDRSRSTLTQAAGARLRLTVKRMMKAKYHRPVQYRCPAWFSPICPLLFSALHWHLVIREVVYLQLQTWNFELNARRRTLQKGKRVVMKYMSLVTPKSVWKRTILNLISITRLSRWWQSRRYLPTWKFCSSTNSANLGNVPRSSGCRAPGQEVGLWCTAGMHMHHKAKQEKVCGVFCVSVFSAVRSPDTWSVGQAYCSPRNRWTGPDGAHARQLVSAFKSLGFRPGAVLCRNFLVILVVVCCGVLYVYVSCCWDSRCLYDRNKPWS